LVELFIKQFGSVPVSGDRIQLDGFEVTVKELDELSQIKTFGLKMPNRHAAV
jgi:cell volume regulation protein A